MSSKAWACLVSLFGLWSCTEPSPVFRGGDVGEAGGETEGEGGEVCDDLCPIGAAYETSEEARSSCRADGVILADEGGDFGVCVREEGCHGLCRFALPCPCGLERLYPVTCLRCP